MIGKELERDRSEDRRNEIRTFRDTDHVVGEVRDLFSAFGGDGNHRPLTSFDLFDALNVLLIHRVIRRDHDRRDIRPDQRDDSMLKLGAWMTFRELVTDLFQLQSTFQRNRVVLLPAKKQKARRTRIFLRQLFDYFAFIENLTS